MRLVDDEDAVAGLRRREHGAFAQLTHVVDTAVGGGVELHHVQVPGATRRQRHAGRALATRSGCRPLNAVQRARQDARRGRLATPPRPRKQVRMADAPVVESVR